jgi:hypothetical protein
LHDRGRVKKRGVRDPSKISGECKSKTTIRNNTMNNIISASFFDDQLDPESKLRLGPIVSFSISRIHRLHDARRKTHDPPHTNTTHTDDRRHSRSSKTARCVALRWRYVCVYVASCKDRLRSIRRLKPPPSFDRPSQSPSSSPPPNTFNLPTQPRPPQKKEKTPRTHPVGEDDERSVLIKLWVREDWHPFLASLFLL